MSILATVALLTHTAQKGEVEMPSEKEIGALCPFKPSLPPSERGIPAGVQTYPPGPERECDGRDCELWVYFDDKGLCAFKAIALSLAAGLPGIAASIRPPEGESGK